VKKKKGGYGTASSPFSFCAGGEGYYHMQKKRKTTQTSLFILFSSPQFNFFLMFLGFSSPFCQVITEGGCKLVYSRGEVEDVASI